VREEALRREIAVMKKLRHKNIVALHEIIDDPDAEKLYLVMQYVDKGSLGKVLVTGDCMPRVEQRRLAGILSQVASGLKYLHDHRIVHRDIKPENILLDSSDQAFISDFGVSELLRRKSPPSDGRVPELLNAETESVGETSVSVKPHVNVGTPLFMAPELIRSQRCHDGRKWSDREYAAVDVWALGVSMYALLMGRLPFRSQDDIIDHTAALNFSWIPLTVEASSPPGACGCCGAHPCPVGVEWRTLLRRMLHRDPSCRPTADEVRRAAKAIRDAPSEAQRSAPLMRLGSAGGGVEVSEEDVRSAVSAAVIRALVQRDGVDAVVSPRSYGGGRFA
jgi:serine/threonine protein kinase